MELRAGDKLVTIESKLAYTVIKITKKYIEVIPSCRYNLFENEAYSMCRILENIQPHLNSKQYPAKKYILCKDSIYKIFYMDELSKVLYG